MANVIEGRISRALASGGIARYKEQVKTGYFNA